MSDRVGRLRQHGYTLIEVLIAVSIFSALSLVAYNALGSLSRATEASQVHSDALADLQLTLYRIESDVQSLVIRPRWGQGNEPSDFFGQATMMGGIRSGWANPLKHPRADLQRFQYVWADGRLERVSAPRLTPDPQGSVQRELISDDLEGFELRYLDRSGTWQSMWRGSVSEPLPRAVEWRLQHPRFGMIQRRVVIR